MSTNCMIWVKVNEEDFGKTMTCDVNNLPNPIVDNYFPCLPYKIPSNILKRKLYLGIYCHFDGYPSGVGAELREKFTTYESVLNLILLGGLSFLIDNVRAYHNWRNEDVEIAIARGKVPDFEDVVVERVNTTSPSTTARILKLNRDIYTYVFENGKWVGEKIDD